MVRLSLKRGADVHALNSDQQDIWALAKDDASMKTLLTDMLDE